MNPGTHSEAHAGWMTTDEAAAYLRVSVSQLRKLRGRGEIPAVRLGDRWRYRQDAIDRQLLGRQVEHKAATGHGRGRKAV